MSAQTTPYNTGRLVIGSAYRPKPAEMDSDAQRLQTALLDPRTAKPLPPLLRPFGAFVRWC